MAKEKKLPKIFVLDTNVILHDHRAIYNFQENDIVIPVAVIEELDKFKKGNDTLNFNAREFVRTVDEISDSRLFNGYGYPLGKNLGTISISINRPFPKDMESIFKDDTQDHRIRPRRTSDGRRLRRGGKCPFLPSNRSALFPKRGERSRGSHQCSLPSERRYTRSSLL